MPPVVPNFRSKVEIVLDQLEKFPIIQGKEGIVMTDSWYSSQKLIGGVLQKGLIALMAIKSNRKVSFQGKYFQISKLVKKQPEEDFDSVTVKGKLYRCWSTETKLQTGRIPVKVLAAV